MKIFISLFLILIFFLPACSNVNPIVSDVCEITEEICYYANLVCENFNPDHSQVDNSKEIKSELLELSNKLKVINVNTSSLSPFQKILAKDSIIYDLINIRDELKKIYETQISK
jgi:hypothetical protein